MFKFKVTTSDQKIEYVEARCFTTDSGVLTFYKTTDKEEAVAVYTKDTWLKVVKVLDEE